MFNGTGRQACESFVVRRRNTPPPDHRPVLEFCKTRGLPYDRCVRIALILLQHHLGPHFRVASDDANWEAAKRTCRQHLGYGQEFHLDQ
jgi:hypothetical protein